MLFKGVANDWPAKKVWSFEFLARLGGSQQVQLVMGNREIGPTSFAFGRLDEYLSSLEQHSGCLEEPATYLKEFDLLRRIPGLEADAHTGLHYDHLDNLAVVVRGQKRFFLAKPGTIEALGAVSSKYDRWARLSRIRMTQLVDAQLPPGALFCVDLEPGLRPSWLVARSDQHASIRLLEWLLRLLRERAEQVARDGPATMSHTREQAASAEGFRSRIHFPHEASCNCGAIPQSAA